ncbi:MAG: EAL domain-containing protein [Alphaproteobacteria bacterium]|nr:EAL domain-containing protein [Alphaproteobacteria bacterium]MBF0129876.1 EAL domain-containing protein [Alphaproteobacteria bacterium]
MTPPSGFPAEWGERYFMFSPFLCAVCREGKVVMINPAGVELLRAESADSLIGTRFADLLHPDYGDELGGDILDVLAEERAPVPVRMARRDWSVADVHLRCIRGGGDDGALLVIGRDISENLNSARAILRSETRYRELVNHAIDSMFLCSDGIIEFVNLAGLRLLRMEHADEVVGRPFWDLLQRDYSDAIKSEIDQLVRDAVQLPAKIVLSTMEIREVLMAFIPLDRTGSRQFMVDARDITDENRAVAALRASHDNLEHQVEERTRDLRTEVAERRKAEERIRHQAHHDLLTGLPNRSQFFERLQHELARARGSGARLALMFIDLDGFKGVNDTLGHEAGDLLLKAASQRMLGTVRGCDVVSRLGGDEFTVIMPEVDDKASVAALGHRLIESLQRPFGLKGATANISGSIGISLFPDDGDMAETLLHNADGAMYRSKKAGKGVFTFHSDALTPVELDRIAIRECLRFAVDRDELDLYYMPKIDLVRNVVVGVEALLRWKSAELGLVMPSRLIPAMVQEEDLSDRVARWVVCQATTQMLLWKRQGFGDVRVAINLTARELRIPGFVATIERCLKEKSLAPRMLEIEVTESSIFSDIQHITPVLASLDTLGVGVVIDNFGTGYSSLRYLQKLPVRAVKIDRGVIANMGEGSEEAAVVHAIIATAHAFGRRVIAEGVETETKMRRLAGMGCDEAQGYLFSTPQPADAAQRFLAGWISSP